MPSADRARVKAKKLSKERQQYAAEALEQIAEAGDAVYALTDEERRLACEDLNKLDRGEVAASAEARR